MKSFIFYLLLAVFTAGCSSQTTKNPEPHLELGQGISFVGARADKTYVIVGYRHMLEDKTEKRWNEHDYIVVSYTNDQGDIKLASIHRNAVLKK